MNQRRRISTPFESAQYPSPDDRKWWVFERVFGRVFVPLLNLATAWPALRQAGMRAARNSHAALPSRVLPMENELVSWPRGAGICVTSITVLVRITDEGAFQLGRKRTYVTL